MGAFKMFSSSSYDYGPPGSKNNFVEAAPNPQNYRIQDRKEVNGFTILAINYPDCTNYEGDKIVVYESLSFLLCSGKEKLDPHFCEDKRFSPVARFEPTERGWDWAIKFCENAR